MNRPALTALAIAAMILAACNPPPVAKTVDYYAEHVAERDARMTVCRNNPGELKNDPDCINAATSLRAGWTKRDMPPITFAAPASAASR